MSKSDTSIPWGAITHIHISNISEDVWPFIQSLPTETLKKNEIDENARLADRNIFSEVANPYTLIVLPIPAHRDHLDYAKEILDFGNVSVVAPRNHSGRTCYDIMTDKSLLNRIRSLIKNQPITLTSYSASRDFAELVKILERNAHPLFTTPELPIPYSRWTPDFIGSKTGIRQLAQISTLKISLPEGYITSTIHEAAEVGSYIHRKHGGVVFKIPKGHSGAGVLIFSPHDLTLHQDALSYFLLERLRSESIFDNVPIVVERYLTCTPHLLHSNPSFEYQIEPNGSVRFLYACAMRVTKQGVFKGIEISKSTIPPRLTKDLMESGMMLGDVFSSLGYRGYFDMDCIVSDSGKAYISECNLRRTGGTHAFHLAQYLLGDHFLHTSCVLAHNLYDLPDIKVSWSFEFLLNRLSPILFKPHSGEGLIITSTNLLTRGQFGYVIFGQSRARALAIESKMQSLLTLLKR